MLSTLFLLSSCSFTDLAYNHLDLLARYFISDYIDFTADQRHDFDQRFDTVWRWHRGTQMPQYAATAHEIAQHVLEPQPVEQVSAMLNRIDGFGEALGKRVMPEAAPFLATLSDEQVTRLLSAIDKKIAKEQAHATRDDDATWHEHEFKESRDSFEKYIGNLTAEQEARIHQYTDASVRDTELYQRVAVDTRKRFADLLVQRHQPDFPQRLQAFFDIDTDDSKQVEHRRQESRERYVQLVSDLSNTYSPKQRRHFHDQVESLAKEFDDLAKQASAPA